MTTMNKGWKVLNKGMVSDANKSMRWGVGQWKEVTGNLSMCNNGLHGSKLLVDAIQFVAPGVICLVEYGTEVIEDDTKFCSRRMRVLKTYKFTKRNAIEFSIFCAKLCLKNFESKYPDDKRPRQAIEAAENFLKNPSEKNKSAARSAAWSAESAESAAWSAARSAARSAESAAWSAESAARSAESAARSAARSAESAESAAWSAESAESAAKQQMENKLLKIIGHKTKVRT